MQNMYTSSTTVRQDLVILKQLAERLQPTSSGLQADACDELNLRVLFVLKEALSPKSARSGSAVSEIVLAQTERQDASISFPFLTSDWKCVLHSTKQRTRQRDIEVRHD